MSTLLYVEASPRKARSHSIKVSNAFIDAYRSANPADQIDTLDLWAQALPAFDGDMIDAKYSIMHGEEPTTAQHEAWGEVEKMFKRFNDADKYVFSVPMWNFGIPYVLKHYIDVITQPGLAWSFDPETGYTGLVSGRVAAIYSSGGAYHDGSGAEAFDQQKPYFEAWLGFVGLTDVTQVTAAPTLGAPDDVEQAVSNAVGEAQKLGAAF